MVVAHSFTFTLVSTKREQRTTTMKIIAFGASTSSTSINKTLATYAANLVEGADVQVLDLNSYDVPLFSEDKEKEIGQAEGAKAFLADIATADALRFLC